MAGCRRDRTVQPGQTTTSGHRVPQQVRQLHGRSPSMAQSRTTLDPAEAILAALAQLGQTTAADIATAAGLAYSTTTRNLRELAAAGRVEKVTDGKQSQWRLPSGGSPQASATSAAEAGAEGRAEGGTDTPTAIASPSTLD